MMFPFKFRLTVCEVSPKMSFTSGGVLQDLPRPSSRCGVPAEEVRGEERSLGSAFGDFPESLALLGHGLRGNSLVEFMNTCTA